MAVAPSRAQPLGLVHRATAVSTPSSARNSRCRARTACRRPCRSTPLPVGESKCFDLRKSQMRALWRPRTIAAASGCSLARSTLAASRRISFSSKPVGRHDRHDLGLPSVSVPVLSTTSVSTFSIRSSASAFLISTPACAPRPTPTMIDIGVARPSAQGQAMISTVTAATRPNARRGSGPNAAQAAKASNRHGDDRRHEPAGDLVGEPLDRRPASLRLGHHLDDPGQHRVAADLVGAHDEAAGWLRVPPITLAPASLVTGMDSPVTMRFVERRAAFEHHAVDRHFFAGPDAQAVADLEAVDLDVSRRRRRRPAARSSAPGRAARDGAGGLLARAQLQHLAEQDEHGDDGGGLEVDRDRAIMAAKRRREDAGRDGADQAVEHRPRRCPWRSA